MLILLRLYESEFGIPDFGGLQVQRNIISNITRELYQSGAPTWVLEPVMERVAEGLIGRTDVQFCIFPRQAFVFYPSSANSSSETDMLKLQPGFHMHRLVAVEDVAIRLASFASDTKGPVQERFSSALGVSGGDLMARAHSVAMASIKLRRDNPTAHSLAKEILDLSSSTFGLFYFLNRQDIQKVVQSRGDSEFWEVKDSTLKLFSRLAADEASQSLTKILSDKTILASPLASKLCRFSCAAGVSAMWFGGSFPDMLVAGVLAVMAGSIANSRTLALEERIPTEMVASFAAGVIAGLLSLKWPHIFCFGAMAVASLLELFQGYKILYAVTEILSQKIATGTARMVESILVTGLISYSIRFGLIVAFRLMYGLSAPLPKDVTPFLRSFNAIGKIWYPLVLPLAVVGWSGLFWPRFADLPMMMFHGMMACTLHMCGVPSFASSMCISLLAGIISRFTGRGALGNTLAGLYVFVPGVFMVRGMFSATTMSFLEAVVSEAVVIGLGTWLGTVLCSLSIFGKPSGQHDGVSNTQRSKALIYF